MKKIATIVTLGMLLWAVMPRTAQGQNTACNGLKNPVNFTLYNNTTTGQYTGKVGSKLEQSGNCLTGGTGLSLTTDVANSQLATVTDGGGSSYCGSSLGPSNRFRIMSNTEGPGTGNNLGKDPLTNYGLPYCPAGFTKSIRVGNCQTSGYAEALYYTFTVNNYNALVFLHYAIVAQAPGHGVAADPQFIIRVTKQQGGNWVPLSDTLCYTVSTTPTGSSGGTVQIGQDGWHANGNVYYRDWNQCVINLSKYYTQTVRIEVMFGDCEWQGHYGYAYVAGECRPMTLNINGCAAGEGTAVATIEAPSGMSEYKWFRSRTGVLQGTARTTETNYQQLPGETNQTLNVTVNHFITASNDTLQQNTFKCEMTSYMDPLKPIISNIYTEVGNTKPTLSIDTVLYCDGTVTLRDRSFCRFVTTDADNVDTSLSVWKIYGTPAPSAQSYLGSLSGGTVNYQFPDAGRYSVKLRTSAHDTTCWNEKTVEIRAIKYPTPRVRFQRNELCSGDTIALYDETQGHTVNPVTNPTATWHQWTFHLPEGDTTITSTTSPAIQMSFTESTDLTLVSRTNMSFMLDSNHDGTIDTRYCFAQLDTTVLVGQFPVLTVHGDTIVCNGDQTDIWVESDLHGCRFDWYYSLFGSTPLVENNSHMVISITQDRTYYVKVTSSNGCESWDSVRVYIVDPRLEVPVTEVCDNTPVALHASNAYSYTWTAMPNDPSLTGHETDPDIIVTPHQTTTYTLVGHGMNNCSTTPLTRTVTVYPFPVPAVQLTPDFIDSENPTVTFRDVSEGATTSLWDFGGGHTSTDRQVRHTFTDLSEDSVLVSLTTGNDLNCTSDTSFWLPVELFSLWFPNAFTPTLGTNRTFGPFTHNTLEYYSLYIYNRAGLEVFQSHDQTEEWDGRFHGKYCDQGAYVYVCTYRRPGTEDVVTIKGTVLLLQ